MRTTYSLSQLIVCGLLVWLSGPQSLLGQTETPQKLFFNGLGRTIIDNTQLNGEIAETDTSTSKNLMEGEFLLDLKVNAAPNENTEVQSIIRLRNEFGGLLWRGNVCRSTGTFCQRA